MSLSAEQSAMMQSMTGPGADQRFLMTFGIASIVVALLILGRWWFSKKAWAFHPMGRDGFLKDEFLRLGAIFYPYAITMLVAKVVISKTHPEWFLSPYAMLALLSIFVFRRLAMFISFVSNAGKRIDAARKAEIEARHVA